MTFVTTQRWNARKWTTTVCDVVDGKPELRVNAWGTAIGKRMRVAPTGKADRARGKRFALSATSAIEWYDSDNLAPFEETPGELKHLAEFGAHISCLKGDPPPPGKWKWETDLLLPEGVVIAYQPELTTEEKDRGAVRPAAVVGSYAVFDAEGCKIAHILRPCVVDATGKRVWGTLSIADGVSTVTFRAADVKHLAAPVTIYGLDTFGYTSVGGSYAGWSAANLSTFGPFTAPANGSATAVSIYLTYVGGHSWTLGIYADNGGTPVGGALLRDTAGANDANDWNEQALDSPLAITSASVYWIGHNHATSSPRIWYDSVAGFSWSYAASAYSAGSLPNPCPSSTVQANHKCSAYITYTPAGGGYVPYRPNMTGGINE